MNRWPRFRPAAAFATMATMLMIAMLVAGVAPVRAGELPRVFFTPAERAVISSRRRAGLPAATAPDAAAVPAAVGTATGDAPRALAAPSRRLDGVTRGSGARAAAWIGGQRIEDGGRWSGYRLQVAANGVRLVAADGSTRFVRVGMEMDR